MIALALIPLNDIAVTYRKLVERISDDVVDEKRIKYSKDNDNRSMTNDTEKKRSRLV